MRNRKPARTPRKQGPRKATPQAPGGAISRRGFLAGATAAGVTAGMPGFLIGCGSDDDASDAPPVERPRELRTLDFDFSYAEVDQLELSVIGSASHRASLVEHDDASRARHRLLNPTLIEVPDDQLTHYVEDVDLPSDALQLVRVKGRHVATGDEALVSMHIHTPIEASREVSARAEQFGIHADRWGQATTSGSSTVIDLDTYQTPVESAVALVFHNHEITNLNVDQGTAIIDLIQTLPCTGSGCTPYISTVAEMIAAQWPATPTGGWATLEQILDTNGDPLLDSNGKPMIQYVPSDEIAEAACSVAAQVKKVIFDDPDYEGNNYHPTEGMTADDGSGSQSAALSGTAAPFDFTGSHPAGTSAHGVKFETISVIDQTNRQIQIEFRNAYVRYLSCFVQFANENGDLPVEDPTSVDTSRSKFLAYITSNYTILGIPLVGNDIPLSSVGFDVPEDASIAKVYFGSLGLGGQAFSPEAVGGSSLTLTFNIGLPAFFLIAGVVTGASLQATILKYLLTSDGIQIVNALTDAVRDNGDANDGIFGGTESSSQAGAKLASIGNALLTALFAGTAQALKSIAEDVTEEAASEEAAEEAAGPFGLVFKLIAIAANLAALTESIAESLASPAIFTNEIKLTQTTTVTISHDDNDFQFPATARNYEVVLTYDGSSVQYKHKGTISPGRVDPIVETFEGVPSGGMVTVDVYLTTDANCIVGRSTDSGTSDGNAAPYGPVSGTEQSIDLMIKELLVPLTEDTEYDHVLKLEYQDGQHVWVQTDAPTATLGDLCAGADDALCAANEITISQRTGMAGYSFEAGGQGIDLCDGSQAEIQQVVQNVFLGQGAESGFKDLSCGFTQPVGIIYERLGPADGTGKNFFLEPSTNSFLVKAVVADASTPFDLDTTMAWGQFSQPLDSLALVPTGYIIGVNRETHKMEILQLPDAAVDSQESPESVAFAVQKMGLGTRIGLLSSPVAVTAFGTTILILEDGNRRIQAVDVSGNPVAQFDGQTSSIIDLTAIESNPSDVVYLDIAVEGLGYMYVLSYENGGLSPDDYRLDIYVPDGEHLLRKTGVAAARMAVDTFRNVYTLNYEAIAGAPRVEPSLSQWEPSTPDGCPTPTS